MRLDSKKRSRIDRDFCSDSTLDSLAADENTAMSVIVKNLQTKNISKAHSNFIHSLPQRISRFRTDVDYFTLGD